MFRAQQDKFNVFALAKQRESTAPVVATSVFFLLSHTIRHAPHFSGLQNNKTTTKRLPKLCIVCLLRSLTDMPFSSFFSIFRCLSISLSLFSCILFFYQIQQIVCSAIFARLPLSCSFSIYLL